MEKTEKKTKYVTLRDIAKRLGISTNAVSKALKDASDISETTKERVRKMAAELGYVPNSFAADLKRGISNQILIVFNDFNNPYFPIFCNKAFAAIKDNGYDPHLYFCRSQFIDTDIINATAASKFCGVISFVEPTVEVSSFFKKKHIPFCLIGINSSVPYIDCVFTDDYHAGRLIGEYFLEGPRTKALYVSDSPSETSYRRYSGFVEAIKDGKSNKSFELVSGNDIHQLIKITYNKILKESIDFVFCHSDSLALTIHSHLAKEKYDKKITLTGFDNLHKYSVLYQKITSIDYNMDEILHFTLDVLIKKIKQEIPLDEYIKKMFDVTLDEK